MVSSKKPWSSREASAVTAVVAALLAIGSAVGGTVVLYVDADAPPGGNGLSWGTAFQNPHQAYEVANPSPGKGPDELMQIWVAEGTYKPTLILEGNPEETSFFLVRNLEYLGGFAGTETSAEQRDPEVHVTILSGDVGVPGIVTDNSRRVVRAGSTADATAVLDGFTITGGYADQDLERGGGLFCEGGKPTVRRCRFVDNYALRKGGAVYTNGPATFIECEFIDNAVSLERGGGIGSDSSTITVLDCHFEGNAANTGGGLYGGGLVENCTFVGNTASSAGGGAFSFGTIRNCTFADNTTTFNGGGGLDSNSDVPLKVSNCAFINNSGGGARGGGARIGSATIQATIANCIFLGNSATTEGGGLWSSANTTMVINCLFSGNNASLGGGLAGWTVNVRNCSIGHNTASASTGGGLWTDAIASVRNSVLWSNTAAGASGYSAQISMFSGSTIQWSCIQGWTSDIGGIGNVGADPAWLNPLGPDLIAGTEDDNLRPAAGSPCIDSSQNSSVPADSLDLDGDGNTVEPVPVDLDSDERFFDDVKTPDTGSGVAPLVDMGAYEFDGDRSPIGPGTYVGPTGGSWFEPTHWAGGAVPDEDTDVFIDDSVVIAQAGAAASTVTLLAGGSLSLQNGTLDTGAVTIAAGASLILSGATAALEADLVSVQTGGSLQWNAGTIQIHQSFASASGITIGCSGAALLHMVGNPLVTAPSITVCGDGELRGTGIVSSSLTNGGLVSPGAPVGTLTINGSYIQSAAGKLAMVIGGYVAGDQSSFLVVNGAAMLDGALAMVVLPLFQHELVGINQLVAAGSIAGQFDLADLPDLPGLFQFQLQSSDTSVSLLTTLSSTSPRLHVDDDAAAGGDGQTWATAVRGLDGALAVQTTFPDLVDEVWVATGTYHPTQRTDPVDPRSATFTIPDGILLVGGFVGGETAASQANPSAHPTILSGDLLGNDKPDLQWLNPTVQDNCYHVLVTSGTTEGTLIDGFIIRDGNADLPGPHSRGGGVLNLNGHPIFADCLFTKNRSRQTGGAMHSEQGSLQLNGCTFDDNVTFGIDHPALTGGGALLADHDTVSLQQCDFNANYSIGIGSGASGGMGLLAIDSEVNATDSTFSSHSGQAARLQGVSGDWTDCVFNGNTGGIAPALYLLGGGVAFTGCQFTNNNSGGSDAGAVVVGGGSSSFVDCTFSGNSAGSGDGGAVRVTNADYSDTISFSNCLFSGNSAGAGGAVANDGVPNVIYTGCTFSGNIALAYGGALHCEDFASVKMIDCSVAGNLAQLYGGGLHQFNDATLTLVNTSFSGNIAPAASGLYNRRGSVFGFTTLAGNNSFVNARVFSPGLLPPDEPIALITIDGDYHHEVITETGATTPSLILDIAGDIPGTGHDALQVGGIVQIDGGSLILNFLSSFSPQIGQTFDVVTGFAVTGEFDGVGVAGMPAGLAADVSYLSDRIRVTIVEGKTPIFSDPLATVIIGLPKDATAFDFDNDGFVELAMPIDGSGGPDSMYMLLNGGLNIGGEWLGFADKPIAVDVGNGPSDIAAADLNGDLFKDLVVVRDTNNTITVVRNFGGTLLLPVQNYFVGGQPSDVVIGQLAGTPALDFAVPRLLAGQLNIYRNAGDGSFAFDTALAAGASPSHLALADVDLDGDDDLVASNTSDFFGQAKLSVHLNGSTGFAPGEFYPIGRQTTGLVVAPFNDDDLPDAVVANRLDQNLSVLMADPANPGDFLPAFEVPLGGDPFDMTSLDLDADGDRDLVLIVKPVGVPAVIRPVRNDIGIDGRSVFVVQPDIPTRDIPALVSSADVDSDGDDDLIFGEVVGSGVAGSAGPQTQIVVLLNESQGVFGDLNRDGVVNGFDLAILLAAWGACPAAEPCPEDLNDNGIVNGFDLAILLAEWS